MTLLTTVQNAAEAVGLKPPSSVASATSDTARALKRFAINTAEELLRGHDWSILLKEHEITADGSSYYALPSDLDRVVSDTFWNENDRWRVRGTQTPSEYTRRINSWDLSSTFNAIFIIEQNSTDKGIAFDPQPSTGEVLSFYYISKNHINNGGTLQSNWDADSQTSLIPEHLIELGVIWRMLRRLGREYQSEQADYIRQRDRFFAQDVPAPIINLGPNAIQFAAITPDTGIG